MTRLSITRFAAAVLLALAAGLVAQPPSRPAAEAPPVALAELLGTSIPGPAAWDARKAEVAEYDAVRPVEGRLSFYTTRIVTQRETYSRETYTRASFPHADRPVVEVLEQTCVHRLGREQDALQWFTSLAVRRDNPAAALRMVVSGQARRETVFKVYDFWRERPSQYYMSPVESEGGGTRFLDGGAGALFEEQLPLVLRTAAFRDGATAYFPLYDNQTTMRAPRPRATVAIARIQRPEGAVIVPAGTWEPTRCWEVLVAAEDGRSLRLVFDAAPPRTLIALDHSDGRTLRLVSVETRDPALVD